MVRGDVGYWHTLTPNPALDGTHGPYQLEQTAISATCRAVHFYERLTRFLQQEHAPDSVEML